MNFALAIAFVLIVVAPFIGRWRANVWLRANFPSAPERGRATALPNNVVEIA